MVIYFGLSIFPNVIVPNNSSQFLSSLSSARTNTIYRIISLTSMTVDGTMTDVPDEVTKGQRISVLFNIGTINKVPCVQLLFNLETYKLFTRYYYSNGTTTFWSDWKSDIDNVKITEPAVITPNNYSAHLPTLESAQKNITYKIIYQPSMSSKNNGTWINIPSEIESISQWVGTLDTIGNNIGSPTATTQILTISQLGKIYTRYLNYNGTEHFWTKWAEVGGLNIKVSKDGTGDYSSLTEAIVAGTKFYNTHIYVMPGTYNIIEEYETLYGSDFFTNYSDSTPNTGIILYNNVIIEFSPNAYIICNYQGNNSYVQNRFAPFVAGPYGFTLINAHITDNNVRYSVHDERSNNTDYYHNKYLGCHFIHNKGTGTGYIQALGGGLGVNGLIEIDNCIFESVDYPTSAIVSWHNSISDGARSQIFIRNSIIKGSIRFSWYGSSTLISTMVVTGCKMYAVPWTSQETLSYNIENVEIIAWGNEIETAS